jgi:hypothetical protein
MGCASTHRAFALDLRSTDGNKWGLQLLIMGRYFVPVKVYDSPAAYDAIWAVAAVVALQLSVQQLVSKWVEPCRDSRA